MIPFSIILQSIVAHLYPAYRTYQVVQHGRQEELKSWLTYWAVLGMYHVAESFTDSFVWWLPFYDDVKLFILIYLVFPRGQGAHYIYRRYLQPYFFNNETRIETYIVTWRNRFSNFIGAAVTDAVNRVNIYLQEMSNRHEPTQPVVPGVEFEDVAGSAGPRIFEIIEETKKKK